MSVLIGGTTVRKSFASRPLFDGISFAVETGERIGLIGPNGAGKSTLLRILAGQDTADSGTISRQRGLRIGFLEQTPVFTEGATVEETIMEGAHDPHEWQCIAAAQEFMSRLSLDGSEGISGETLVSTLSGGWKKRVALARELIRDPDILFLDEPTNHLDVESILWLEDFLNDAKFATITITHDRLFLQRIANRIWELDRRNPGGLLSIQGDYANYLESKELLMAAQERRETVLKNTLRRETEWLRQGVKARGTKSYSRIKAAGELKKDVEELEYRNVVRTAKFDFHASEANPKRLVEATGISKSYGDHVLFKDVDLLLTPGIRIGLLGPNGCGKSTLIRVLLGQEEADSGTIERAELLQVAYFEQNRETLDPNATVSKTLCPIGDHVKYRGSFIHVRGYLDRFLFSQVQMDMEVRKLSGGEQSRLLIARLMLQEANVLVLDEPTNDLDMATLTVLENCLMEFPGAVLLVTHDRYFLDQVANRLLAFGEPGTDSAGEIIPFASMAQWETWFEEQQQAKRKGGTKGDATKSDSKPAAPKRKLSFKEQFELDHMEETIHKAEAALEKLTAESMTPEVASHAKRLTEISSEMNALQTEIDRLYARWSELTA